MPEAASPFVVNLTNSARFYRLYLACVTAPAGIVSWWPGNGNVNDIISADNGALLGSATFANGKVGQAFSFDGNSGCAVIPASDSLNPTGPFSVEFWIRASSVQFYPQVLLVDKSHGWTDSTGWLFQTFPNQGTVGFGFGLGGPTVVNFPLVATATSVFDDQWHHLAGVWTGSELQIYLDGGLQGTLAETNSPVNNSRGVEFGRSWGGGTPTRYFHGLIDEVSYYNTALSSNQVNAIYTAGAAGKCNP